MGYYTKNGGLIGTGAIEKGTGVSDIVASQLLGSKSVFDSLIELAGTLSSATVPTVSNFQSIQSLIEVANEKFNVFAVVGPSGYAEQCSGVGAAGGKRTLTAKSFNYNTSSSNIISTGNTIADMDGGAGNSLSAIDGNKWMAMAQFDGTNFDGILVWIFTGDQVSNTGTITSGTRSVTNVRDIFYPVGSSSNYHHIYPIAIDPSGTVTSNTTSGASGWNFSNGSNAVSTIGYNSNGNMSGDDGQWGFVMPGYTDGNGAGSIFSTSPPGYGMGNQNSGDSNTNCYWNGTNAGSNDQLGFVFSGDAL